MRLIAFTLELAGEHTDDQLAAVAEAAERPDVAVLTEGETVSLVGPADSIADAAASGARVGRHDGIKIRCRVEVLGEGAEDAGQLAQQVATRFQERLAAVEGEPPTRPITNISVVDPLAAAMPFLEAVSDPTPAPGGGSASALAGAAAAALVAMVAGITAGKDEHEDIREEMERARDRALLLRNELHALVRTDAEAYQAYLAALRLPRETEEQQTARRDAASKAAMFACETPLEVMRRCVTVVELAARLARRGARAAATDAAVGAMLAGAAVRCAWANVRVNLPAVRDLEMRAHFSGEAGTLARKAEEVERHAVRASEVEDR